MPNNSSGKDLQNYVLIRPLFHDVICVTKCQRASRCFSFIIPSSFSSDNLSFDDSSSVPETLAIRSP